MAEELLALGHPEAWDYSPRRMIATLGLARKRQGRDAAMLLSMTRLAYHGEKSDVEKTLRDLMKR